MAHIYGEQNLPPEPASKADLVSALAQSVKVEQADAGAQG